MSAYATLQHDACESSEAVDRVEASEGRLRLTRRGRVVFGALGAVLLAGALALVALFAAPQALASNASSTEQFHYVVVQPGASLWSVATELDPEADPRDLVAELAMLNQLEASEVEAGQALAVPLRYSEGAEVYSAAEVGS